MECPKDRLVGYLQSAYATELGIAEMLGVLLKEVDSGQAAGVLREHLGATRDQAQRLEERLAQMGAQPTGADGFFNTLICNMEGVFSHDEKDKTTQALIKAYAAEHFEQGMYSSLITYAEACGDYETVDLAEEILAEEEEAALKLFPMIERSAQQAFDRSRSERPPL